MSERPVVDRTRSVAAVRDPLRCRGPCAARGKRVAVCIVACSAASISPERSARRRRFRRWSAASSSRHGDEPLGVTGDLLGVHGVRIDAGPGVRLVVAGRARGPPPGRGPRPPAARVARGSLAIGPSASSAPVFCSISRAAASRSAGRVSAGSLPTSPSSWAVRRSIRLTCSFSGSSSVLGGGEVRQAAAPAELLGGVRLGLGELGLHLGPAAQPPIDLDVAQLPCWTRSPRRSHAGDEREDRRR